MADTLAQPARADTGLEALVGNQAMAQIAHGLIPHALMSTLARPGRPLDPALRRAMEARFGQDFSGVRVHADEPAGGSARSIRASAYTVGDRIVVRPDRYRPEQADGQALIAHELAHVVQQRRGGDGPAAGAAAEQDANEAAGAAVTGQQATVSQGGAPAVARQSDDENPYLRAAIQRHLASQYQLHLDQDLVSSLAPPLPQGGVPPLPQTLPTSPMAPPPPIPPLSFKPPPPLAKPKSKKKGDDDDDDDLPGSEFIYPGRRKIKSGSPSDLLKAVSKIPEVDALGTAAGDKAGHDFGKLSTGEKVLLGVYGAGIAGTAGAIGYSTKDPTASKGLLGGLGKLGGAGLTAGLHKLGLGSIDADLSLFSNPVTQPFSPHLDFTTAPPTIPDVTDLGQGALLKLKGKF